MIADRNSNQMVDEGTEDIITPLNYSGVSSMKAMVTKYNGIPKGGSHPFGANCVVLVMGEGAGVVVIQLLDSALTQGARFY